MFLALIVVFLQTMFVVFGGNIVVVFVWCLNVQIVVVVLYFL